VFAGGRLQLLAKAAELLVGRSQLLSRLLATRTWLRLKLVKLMLRGVKLRDKPLVLGIGFFDLASERCDLVLARQVGVGRSAERSAEFFGKLPDAARELRFDFAEARAMAFERLVGALAQRAQLLCCRLRPIARKPGSRLGFVHDKCSMLALAAHARGALPSRRARGDSALNFPGRDEDFSNGI
jgi:hypothetical protein